LKSKNTAANIAATQKSQLAAIAMLWDKCEKYEASTILQAGLTKINNVVREAHGIDFRWPHRQAKGMERARAIAVDPHGLTPVGSELKASFTHAASYTEAVRKAKMAVVNGITSSKTKNLADTAKQIFAWLGATCPGTQGHGTLWDVLAALPSRPVALAVPGARAAAYARVVSDVMRAVQCAP
jgi:hypothetical protein